MHNSSVCTVLNLIVVDLLDLMLGKLDEDLFKVTSCNCKVYDELVLVLHLADVVEDSRKTDLFHVSVDLVDALEDFVACGLVDLLSHEARLFSHVLKIGGNVVGDIAFLKVVLHCDGVTLAVS